MIKEYRVWQHGSTQGHYMIADSPKRAVIKFVRGLSLDFPIHVILWKKGKNSYSLKMTKEAIEFKDCSDIGKYYNYGRKYYKKDLKYEVKNV